MIPNDFWGHMRWVVTHKKFIRGIAIMTLVMIVVLVFVFMLLISD
jgi:hypothetical protein